MIQTRTNTLVIRTPEGVSFSLELAGPLTRFLAWAIDFACITAALMTASTLGLFLRLLSGDAAGALLVLLYFGISVGYPIACEWWWRGQTLGKRLLRLRVVDAQGLRLQFSQIVIRNLLRPVDMLPAVYLVGGIACMSSKRAQRIGDYAANTVVVRSRPAPNYDVAAIIAGKYNSFRAFPHIEMRLRQRTSPQEAAVALHALLRRGELDADARLEFFRNCAEHFKRIVTFPEEAVIGVTDEQYVRNAVDTLFRT